MSQTCVAERNTLTDTVSCFIERVCFVNYYPLLSRATADNDNPTPGYLYADINKISFESAAHCQQLLDYLIGRSSRCSCHTKLKVIKIMMHLVENGHVDFRKHLRKKDDCIKMMSSYSGPPDPLVGSSLYQMVREAAEELLAALFDPEIMKQDETGNNDQQKQLISKPTLAGYGSSGGMGKYEGFGNAPVQREEGATEKMLQLMEKLLNPPDETTKIIHNALSSSYGQYEPITVDAIQTSYAEGNTASVTGQKTTRKQMKAHVPGKAGGGWESEEEPSCQQALVSPPHGSTISADSLEKLDTVFSEEQTAAEYQLIHEFCADDAGLPVKRVELNAICKKCSTLNCYNVLAAINTQLQVLNPLVQMRALLMVEWFLRTDLLTPTVIIKTISENLVRLEDGPDSAVQAKARKISLIVNKLKQMEKMQVQLKCEDVQADVN